MAVRHLKRYASWVQTVEKLKCGASASRGWFFNRLNPEVIYIKQHDMMLI
jgi:hypothetical protein